MKLEDLFSSIESTLLSRFKESGFINHNGDKGENREEILIEFLRNHLPKRYGVTKGEVIIQKGERSHAIDIIIYDSVNCPVLYAGKTSILPIEGVYGIIEVKSTLSKNEALDALSKVESFKKLAPRELGITSSQDAVTLHRPSRPFGIVLGYQLSSNSITSLKNNWKEQAYEVHDVNYVANLICVLGEGLLHFEKYNLTKGEKDILLDTDEFVDLVTTAHKRHRNGEECDEILAKIIAEETKDRTFGRFIMYLLIMLTKIKLNVPDLTRYIDPELPMTIVKE